MLFNSKEFAVFFPLVTLLYFLVPTRTRWVLLLAASCYFYMVFIPKYILILAFLILFDYFAGLALENADPPIRKIILACSLLANVSFLAVFKYFDFLVSNVSSVASFFGWRHSPHPLSLLLPVGLSFHTFQSMSYTIEVYRRKQKPERHLGIFALYIMFYPQLVAGPIERPYNLLRQFREEYAWDSSRVLDGLRLMLRGLFKKMVVADSLAIVVNRVFDQPSQFPSHSLMVAAYFFTFQIYCDFSGYSDVARGAARVMGFSLMRNFDHPFFSKSLVEFWHRWHISLSTWFRDYLYFPLGGGRCSVARRYMNLFVVFLVSGLWHGANWTFIAWGTIHGLFMLALLASKGVRDAILSYLGLDSYPRLCGFLGMFCTFHVVVLSFVFFRANSVGDALYILRHLWPFGGSFQDASFGSIQSINVALGVAQIVSLGVLLLLERKDLLAPSLAGKPAWIHWSVSYLLGAYLCTLAFISLNIVELKPQRFIYFQF